MGADLVLLTDCPVKQALGEGDAIAGADRLYNLCKQRRQAEAIAAMATRDGRNAATATFRSVVIGPRGPVERNVSVQAVREATAVLDTLSPHCAGCPANCVDTTFGCVGVMTYPISASAEAWLMRRVQPASSLGGSWLLKAIADFNYDGETIRAWRERGMFERRAPAVAVLKKKLFSVVTVSADQLFEAILTLEEPLAPSHCMMLLLFLGALHLDGEPPGDASDADWLRAVMALSEQSHNERLRRTSLVLGDASDDPGVQSMQMLLKLLYHAWLTGDPLFIDA